jgi:hypothetical protein
MSLKKDNREDLSKLLRLKGRVLCGVQLFDPLRFVGDIREYSTCEFPVENGKNYGFLSLGVKMEN